jgi:hypothetical protein
VVAVGEPVVDHRRPRVDRFVMVVADGVLGAQQFDRACGLAVAEQFGGVAVDRVAEPVS